MHYTGVDWSGDPGLPGPKSASTSQLVFAFVSIASSERDRLHEALEHVRDYHRKSNRFVFHYVDCPTSIANTFFEEIARVELEIRIGVINKERDWNNPGLAALTGQVRLLDALVSFSTKVPSAVVSRSALLIDSSKSERKFALSARRSIRAAFDSAERACFRDIRICPDGNNPDGELIQVADMVAGAVRRSGSLLNPQTRLVERRIVPWHEVDDKRKPHG